MIKFLLLTSLVLLAIPSNAHAQTADAIAGQLREYFQSEKLSKVTVKTVGSVIIVGGEVEIVHQIDQVEKILQALNRTDQQVQTQNVVRICPSTWNAIAERIEREIGSPEITARIVNRTIFLEGTAESDFEADRSVAFAKAYLARERGERVIASNEANMEVVDLLRVRPAPGVGKLKVRKGAVNVTPPTPGPLK